MTKESTQNGGDMSPFWYSGGGEGRGDIPHDQEAEKAILGSIIENNEFFNDVAGLLTPKSFFLPQHQHIYQAIMELVEANSLIDEIILGDQLRKANRISEIGGYAYLAELAEVAPLAGNVVYYARIIQEHALLREVLATATTISLKSKDPSQNVSELLAEAERRLATIVNRSTDSSYSHIKDVLVENFQQLEKASQTRAEITGIPTGFIDLDKMTSGLQASDLIILAARPSMGKTALALNICSHIASHDDVKGGVLIFSLEMSKTQLGARLLAADARLDSQKLRTGRLEADDWDRLAMSVEGLSGLPLYIDDSSDTSPYEIAAKCKELHRKLDNGLSIVVVDYLQLMQGNQKGKQTLREQEIAEISRSLKGIAKELNIPVIALSQLNRSVESRTDKRPQLSDLRESGAIEQDADIILFIYRDEVYNEDSPDAGIAELNVAKHRNGPTGKVRMAFLRQYTKFGNLAKEDEVTFD